MKFWKIAKPIIYKLRKYQMNFWFLAPETSSLFEFGSSVSENCLLTYFSEIISEEMNDW